MTEHFNAESAVEKAKARLLVLREQAAARVADQKEAIRARTIMVPPLSVSGGNTGNTGTALGWRIDDSKPWNERQNAGIHAFLGGKSFCYIGSAGTGKTSGLKGMVNSALLNNIVSYIRPEEATKWLKPGRPGIVLTSFTNMAVRQIAKHFSNDITCITLHKLLEYAPVFYELTAEDGTVRKTMRFEPSRNRFNKLPRSLRTIIIDEGSMVSVDLVNQLVDALPDPASVQWVIIGDLNQLPPTYGGPILGKKLLELPIIELTEVYRQALESPIIDLALKVKDGKAIPVSATGGKIVIDKGEQGKLTIHPWSKALKFDDALQLACDFCKAAVQQNQYDPYKDMILCPQNVSFGVLEINQQLADWMGRQRDAKVYEVVAGFKTHYFAVGDKLLVHKREAIIQRIQWNRNYSGKRPVNPDLYKLDRWGGAIKRAAPDTSKSEAWELENADTDVDAILQSLMSTMTTVEDRKASSSHTIKVRFINGGDPTKWTDKDSAETDEDYEDYTLESAGEVNETLFGYACTVHKSQGSEWRRVFLILHSSLHQMCSRELVYTGITRAAKELYIICEPDRGMKAGTLTKAAKSPRLKGDTLEEKLVSLKAKFDQEAAEKRQNLIEEES